MAEDNNRSGVFVYTEGAAVPHDVVRVRVHPSVTVIPEHAFYNRRKLEEVNCVMGCWKLDSMYSNFAVS